MDLKWAKIDSWHTIHHESHSGHVTHCGRLILGELRDELPANEKSCESCARVVLRQVDRP